MQHPKKRSRLFGQGCLQSSWCHDCYFHAWVHFPVRVLVRDFQECEFARDAEGRGETSNPWELISYINKFVDYVVHFTNFQVANAETSCTPTCWLPVCLFGEHHRFSHKSCICNLHSWVSFQIHVCVSDWEATFQIFRGTFLDLLFFGSCNSHVRSSVLLNAYLFMNTVDRQYYTGFRCTMK